MPTIDEFEPAIPEILDHIPFSKEGETKKGRIDAFIELFTEDIKYLIESNKLNWDDKYSKNETFNKEEVLQKINEFINGAPGAGAPGALDTLNEIATALGNDPNFATTIINLLGNKVDKVTGKQLSTEDYTTIEKTKLSGIQANANNYVHPGTHLASMITQDSTHRFVTDEEKAAISASQSDAVFETAGGTGNVITLTLPTLTNGLSKTFIASANNGGTTTTINSKKIYKPSTTIPPTLMTGKAYTVWYNAPGDCFFIKASAEGDALVSHVLATKKFSTDVDVGLEGTMPNNGVLSEALNCGQSFNIPVGYTSGGAITANSLSSQTSATALANYILYGYTAWVNGIKVTGNIPIKSASTITPSTVNQTIAANQYLSEIQTILGDPDLISDNIKATKSISNITGKASIVDTADATAQASEISSGKTAYVNGSKVTGTGSATRRFVTGTTKGISGIINQSTLGSSGIRADTLVNITGFDFVPTVAFVYLVNFQMPVVFFEDRAIWDKSIYLKSENNASFIVENGRLQMPGSPNSIGSDYIYYIYE